MEGLPTDLIMYASDPMLLFTYFSLLDKLNPSLVKFAPSSH